ncbi:binding-protein-dependent transport systems inner membrane component [Gloeocapsa sp. PCC 7428]|uniref:ABC transporter permease n=1 Tax=Gloeocapsa sp. PCC 7428 TaxID=1173026 RepID=UPI0002A61F85|nr:ABC transporter permease [Gloeocapsa sp. PCC 7428]AFZ30977.1 binding-protein-dependent transport systems inner membrane component [Gloeocapsa sp. PCC 7428]
MWFIKNSILMATTVPIQQKNLPTGFWTSFLPPSLWMISFYFIPIIVLLSYAFMQHEYVQIIPKFTWQNFIQIINNPGYRNTLFRTIYIATIVTAINAILAFPVAYFLALYAGKYKQILTLLILLPLWSSYLVRVFAWRVILGYNGVLNSFLVSLGIFTEPSSLFLYNQFSMVVTLCYVWLPFMILPLVTALERLPKNLLEASADLGANSWNTFRKVTFPLVLPGLLAGGISVFSLTVGDYITASLVGGAGDILVGNIVASQFGVADNWPLGAAFALVILLLLFGLMTILSRQSVLENL